MFSHQNFLWKNFLSCPQIKTRLISYHFVDVDEFYIIIWCKDIGLTLGECKIIKNIIYDLSLSLMIIETHYRNVKENHWPLQCMRPFWLLFITCVHSRDFDGNVTNIEKRDKMKI